jgi:exopolysaccharide biosynthesis WecB/TagA/CpsF family protein
VALRPAPLIDIAGVGLNIHGEAEAIGRVIAAARAGQSATLFTLNLDHLVKIDANPEFKRAYRQASFITADGFPIVKLARMQGTRLDRVTGADLVVPLARAAALSRIPVHLFGSTDDVLQKAAEKLQSLAPGLSIAGMEAPPMGFEFTSGEASQAVRRIAGSGARICFVALGAPKQELFADHAVRIADGVVYVCIGAALDFLAGAQKRAPRLLSNIGLEWAWRLAHNPHRMARRYLNSGLYLLRYLARGTQRRMATR